MPRSFGDGQIVLGKELAGSLLAPTFPLPAEIVSTFDPQETWCDDCYFGPETGGGEGSVDDE